MDLIKLLIRGHSVRTSLTELVRENICNEKEYRVYCCEATTTSKPATSAPPVTARISTGSTDRVSMNVIVNFRFWIMILDLVLDDHAEPGYVAARW